MKAVVCVPGGVEATDVEDPAPGPDEVVVAVDACGLCGSDVHAIELGLAAPGQILGHEFAGHVVEVGASVDAGWIGRAVAVNPIGSCGACRACTPRVPFACPSVPNQGVNAPRRVRAVRRRAAAPTGPATRRAPGGARRPR